LARPVAGCLRNSITSKNSASTNPTTQLRRRGTEAQRERKEDPHFLEQKKQEGRFGREDVSERERKRILKSLPPLKTVEAPTESGRKESSLSRSTLFQVGVIYVSFALTQIADPSP
jgi:hypothetical protein